MFLVLGCCCVFVLVFFVVDVVFVDLEFRDAGV